jgi:hypothetical protein
MTTYAIGNQARLATAAESNYGEAVTVSEPFDFISESIAKRGVIVERDGIRGTAGKNSEDTRSGPYTVSGTLVTEPTPEELAIWLPRILGAAASDDTPPKFALAETLPSFTLEVERVNKRFIYAGCKVNKATFSGSEGGLLRLSMDLVGQSESAVDTAFPSLTLTNTAPYIFSDLVLTLQSAARQVKNFDCVVDNNLDTKRIMNSTTITALQRAGDRTITLKTTHAFSSENTDLYDQALAGAAGTLVFTNGGYSTTFTFGTLQCPAESPTVAGKGEVPLVLNMTARMLGSTQELVITHDSTP